MTGCKTAPTPWRRVSIKVNSSSITTVKTSGEWWGAVLKRKVCTVSFISSHLIQATWQAQIQRRVTPTIYLDPFRCSLLIKCRDGKLGANQLCNVSSYLLTSAWIYFKVGTSGSLLTFATISNCVIVALSWRSSRIHHKLIMTWHSI